LREGFEVFQGYETSGAMVLLGATIFALALANSPLREAYHAFWEVHLGFRVGGWALDESLLHWIDDGLMALFFFVVGLEIKREIVVGELRTLRKAALPILGALGGMIAPALLFLALNAGGAGARGWGVPMATDIAFALGALALLGKRIPVGLRVFLAALAIGDDLGAIIIIAVAYTSSVAWAWLGLAAVALFGLLLVKYLRVESSLPYWILGAVVWFGFLNSGVHATMAGVLVALTIPITSRVEPMTFVERARDWLAQIADIDVEGEHVLATDDQQHVAQQLQRGARWMQAPLQRMEHAMLPVTTYIILPLFALANAGITVVGTNVAALLLEPVSLGVVVGLVLGKQIGITAMTWLAVRLGIADLPTGVTWRQIYGVAWLGGIGFTMSIFIAGLAFRVGVLQTEAKLAVLVASVIAGVGGWLVLRGTGAAGVTSD
jgi:NhaA family Na+:H+ antiporter